MARRNAQRRLHPRALTAPGLGACAAVLVAVSSPAALAGGPGEPSSLPEMRSYQPYSGLQYGFRPQPPRDPFARRAPNTVILPQEIPQVIEYGSVPRPYSSGHYSYCTPAARCD